MIVKLLDLTDFLKDVLARKNLSVWHSSSCFAAVGMSEETFVLFHPPVQLVVRFFRLRLSDALSRGLFLVLLLGLEGKWIFTGHNLFLFCKIKINS